jgi:putative endonuclease
MVSRSYVDQLSNVDSVIGGTLWTQGRPFLSVTPARVNRRLALGRAGEEAAAAWYIGRGYEIVDRNWRSRMGEIDLVCDGHDVLVFCEVKTRRSDRLGAPEEAVTRSKQLRLRRLAAEYLFLHTSGRRQVRFDVVAILDSGLTVIEGAF